MRTKHPFICIVCTVLLLMLTQNHALANSWNLPGGLVYIFDVNTDFNNFTRGAADADIERKKPSDYACFEMRSNDQNVLFIAKDSGDKWEVAFQSRIALHQDGWSNPPQCRIQKTDSGGFVISYPGEAYTFEPHYDSWHMTTAQWDEGQSRLRGINDGGLYLYERDGEEIYWTISFISPAEFNIDLMPQSIEEVQRLNTARSLSIFRIRQPFLPYSTPIVYGTGNADVFTAPSADAYRAADGKASVSLKDGLWVLGEVNGWYLVYYRTNAGAGRYGYIKSSSLETSASELEMFRQTVPILRETSLTDDPLTSQSPLMQLNAGQTVDFLSVLEPYHAYVETQKDGRTLRGFVPLRDIDVMTDISGEILPELVGRWEVWAGGTMYANVIDFAADGTCTSYSENPDTTPGEVWEAHAQWRVADYDKSRCFFWNDPEKMIVFTNDNGTIRRYGLVFHDEGFSLTDEEGSGGFQRIDR